MNPQRQNGPERPPRNWILAGCYFAAYSIELMFHDLSSFGSRFISARAGGTAVLMFGWALCHPYDDNTPLFMFMGLVIALTIVARLIAAIREWRDRDRHTRYAGRPYLAWILPLPEVFIKRWVEPLIAFAVGGLIHPSSAPLGSYVMAAGFCQWVCVSIDYHAGRSRKQDINDAIIDQQNLIGGADRFRRTNRRR